MKLKSGYTVNIISEQFIEIKKEQWKKQIYLSAITPEEFLFLWNMMQNDVTKNDALYALLDHFKISTVMALRNLDEFITDMKINNIIET